MAKDMSNSCVRYLIQQVHKEKSLWDPGNIFYNCKGPNTATFLKIACKINEVFKTNKFNGE